MKFNFLYNFDWLFTFWSSLSCPIFNIQRYSNGNRKKFYRDLNFSSEKEKLVNENFLKLNFPFLWNFETIKTLWVGLTCKSIKIVLWGSKLCYFKVGVNSKPYKCGYKGNSSLNSRFSIVYKWCGTELTKKQPLLNKLLCQIHLILKFFF